MSRSRKYFEERFVLESGAPRWVALQYVPHMGIFWQPLTDEVPAGAILAWGEMERTVRDVVYDQWTGHRFVRLVADECITDPDSEEQKRRARDFYESYGFRFVEDFSPTPPWRRMRWTPGEAMGGAWVMGP